MRPCAATHVVEQFLSADVEQMQLQLLVERQAADQPLHAAPGRFQLLKGRRMQHGARIWSVIAASTDAKRLACWGAMSGTMCGATMLRMKASMTVAAGAAAGPAGGRPLKSPSTSSRVGPRFLMRGAACRLKLNGTYFAGYA